MNSPSRARTSPTRSFPAARGSIPPPPPPLLSSSLSPSSPSSSLATVLGTSKGTISSSSSSASAGSGSGAASTTATGSDPTRAPFNYAFGCGGVGYFAWLVGSERSGAAPGRSVSVPALEGRERGGRAGKGKVTGKGAGIRTRIGSGWSALGRRWRGAGGAGAGVARLRLGIPRGSVVFDVSGGIGSTSMLLASAYAEVDVDGSGGLRFVIQDQPVVVEMGEQAWRAKCPELLDSGALRFQDECCSPAFLPLIVSLTHANGTLSTRLLPATGHRRRGPPPPCRPPRLARRIRAPYPAAPHTKLVLADFVLPLACVDDFGVGEGGMDVQMEGAEKMLAPALLLANLGKASTNASEVQRAGAHAARDRRARALSGVEGCARHQNARLALRTYRRRACRCARHARADSGSAFFDVSRAGGATGAGHAEVGEMEMVERASSRCGMPTFGSRVDLLFGVEPTGEEEEVFTSVRCPSALVPLTQSAFILPGYVPTPFTSATATLIAHNSPYPAGAPSDAVPAAAASRALARPAAAGPRLRPCLSPLAKPPFVARAPLPDHAITKSNTNSKPSADAHAAAQHAAPRPLLAQLPQTELRERSGSIVTPSIAGKPSPAWACERGRWTLERDAGSGTTARVEISTMITRRGVHRPCCCPRASSNDFLSSSSITVTSERRDFPFVRMEQSMHLLDKAFVARDVHPTPLSSELYLRTMIRAHGYTRPESCVAVDPRVVPDEITSRNLSGPAEALSPQSGLRFLVPLLRLDSLSTRACLVNPSLQVEPYQRARNLGP
ncbi:hypothetical protein B0H14DRAFT_3523740 [Mycena olivaceomarginata]|nr:hypothetical protein B0H14DRAFT_3523740 [Mycena olivaceomarginata]